MKQASFLISAAVGLALLSACGSSTSPESKPSIVSTWKFTTVKTTVNVFGRITAYGVSTPLNFTIKDTTFTISGDSNYITLRSDNHYAATIDAAALTKIGLEISQSIIATLSLQKKAATSALAAPTDSGTYTWTTDTLALSSKITPTILKLKTQLSTDSLFLLQPFTVPPSLVDTFMKYAGAANTNPLGTIDSVRMITSLRGARSEN